MQLQVIVFFSACIIYINARTAKSADDPEAANATLGVLIDRKEVASSLCYPTTPHVWS